MAVMRPVSGVTGRRPMINTDPLKRKEIEASLNDQAKPSILYKYYLLYQYGFTDTVYCLGFDDEETMNGVSSQFESQKRVTSVAYALSFPYEVLYDGKKKKAPQTSS